MKKNKNTTYAKGTGGGKCVTRDCNDLSATVIIMWSGTKYEKLLVELQLCTIKMQLRKHCGYIIYTQYIKHDVAIKFVILDLNCIVANTHGKCKTYKITTSPSLYKFM